jgi:hypothetical protein
VPPRKAIVVRSIIEIPRIDEQMQRALLEASLAYSNTVNNHKLLYNGYEIRDPRSEYEKEKQKKVKQQLIEKNLESMHLFEQKQGKVLHFHL